MKQKSVPEKVRPELKQGVAQRFWVFCYENRLMVGDAATEAIAQWLERQEASDTKAS